MIRTVRVGDALNERRFVRRNGSDTKELVLDDRVVRDFIVVKTRVFGSAVAPRFRHFERNVAHVENVRAALVDFVRRVDFLRLVLVIRVDAGRGPKRFRNVQPASADVGDGDHILVVRRRFPRLRQVFGSRVRQGVRPVATVVDINPARGVGVERFRAKTTVVRFFGGGLKGNRTERTFRFRPDDQIFVRRKVNDFVGRVAEGAQRVRILPGRSEFFRGACRVAFRFVEPKDSVEFDFAQRPSVGALAGNRVDAGILRLRERGAENVRTSKVERFPVGEERRGVRLLRFVVRFVVPLEEVEVGDRRDFQLARRSRQVAELTRLHREEAELVVREAFGRAVSGFLAGHEPIEDAVATFAVNGGFRTSVRLLRVFVGAVFRNVQPARVAAVGNRDAPNRRLEFAPERVLINRRFLRQTQAPLLRRFVVVVQLRRLRDVRVRGAVKFEISRTFRTLHLVEVRVAVAVAAFRVVGAVRDVVRVLGVGDSEVVEAKRFRQDEVGAFHPPSETEAEVARLVFDRLNFAARPFGDQLVRATVFERRRFDAGSVDGRNFREVAVGVAITALFVVRRVFAVVERAQEERRHLLRRNAVDRREKEANFRRVGSPTGVDAGVSVGVGVGRADFPTVVTVSRLAFGVRDPAVSVDPPTVERRRVEEERRHRRVRVGEIDDVDAPLRDARREQLTRNDGLFVFAIVAVELQ